MNEDYVSLEVAKLLKEIRIQVPEGYEIDEENSTFKYIKFKKRTIDYFEVTRHYNTFITDILSINIDFTAKLRTVGKLMLVAKYLNDGWIPDFKDTCESKYRIIIDGWHNKIKIKHSYEFNETSIYFKSEELAQQAIKILGEEIIRNALRNDY